MNVTLTVTAGPHAGRTFVFDRHDTFLVGRAKAAHLRLSADDPYFSRRHFLLEVNPPRVRVYDLNSHNGVSRCNVKWHENQQHHHHQRWHPALLQRLGQGPTNRVQPRLATVGRCI